MGGKGGPLSYGDGTVFGDGKWHKLEIYIKENTSAGNDGIARVWRDGVKQVEAVNAKTVTAGTKWSHLELMSNWSSNRVGARREQPRVLGQHRGVLGHRYGRFGLDGGCDDLGERRHQGAVTPPRTSRCGKALRTVSVFRTTRG